VSVIKTERNLVCAYDPLPEDRFVDTWLIGTEERHLLLTQPIERYGQAVAWAVGMADKMARHIDVVPITGEEYLLRQASQVRH